MSDANTRNPTTTDAQRAERRAYQRQYYLNNRDAFHRRYLRNRDRENERRAAEGLPLLGSRRARKPVVTPSDYQGRPEEAIVALIAQDQLTSWRSTQVHLIRALTLLSPRTERLRQQNPELAEALPLLVYQPCSVDGCDQPSHRCHVDYNVWHAAGTGLAPPAPPPEAVEYLCMRHSREARAAKETSRVAERGLRACQAADALHRERMAQLDAGMLAHAPYYLDPRSPDGEKARRAINRSLMSSLLSLYEAGAQMTEEAQLKVDYAVGSLPPEQVAKVRKFNEACRQLYKASAPAAE